MTGEQTGYSNGEKQSSEGVREDKGGAQSFWSHAARFVFLHLNDELMALLIRFRVLALLFSSVVSNSLDCEMLHSVS